MSQYISDNDPPTIIKQDRTREWRVNGVLHRENGPAIIYINGDEEWYYDGKLHRENGPAYKHHTSNETVTEKWYHHGALHRDDGPAVIWPDGTQEWRKNGKLHRTDGPAFIWSNGREEWYQKGKRHREDGPAVIYEYENDSKEWWFEGKLHRENGHAVESYNSNEPETMTEKWYHHGVLHHNDGPAIISFCLLYSDGGDHIEDVEFFRAYYKNGVLHNDGNDPTIVIDNYFYQENICPINVKDFEYTMGVPYSKDELYYRNGVKYSKEEIEKIEKLRIKNINKLTLRCGRKWYDKTYENVKSEGFKARMKRDMDALENDIKKMLL